MVGESSGWQVIMFGYYQANNEEIGKSEPELRSCFDGLLLPPNQLETRGNPFENCTIFGFVGRDGFEA